MEIRPCNKESKKLISVIIPTFNRAEILEKTIPSYLQEGVAELIVVDDCSTDNTQSTLKRIANKYPEVRAFTLKKKGKQMGAKNFGIEHSKGELLFFGDDDSILIDGSMKSLLRTYNDNPNTIIGTMQKYLNENETIEDGINSFRSYAENIDDIYSGSNMSLDLSKRWNEQVNLPFCTAHFLVSKKIVGKSRFDEGYKGTCYREETDFIVNLASKGYKVSIDFNSGVINLPRNNDKGGTQHYSFFKKHLSEVFNEYRFFSKNRKYLKKFTELNTNPFVRSFEHFRKKFIRF